MGNLGKIGKPQKSKKHKKLKPCDPFNKNPKGNQSQKNANKEKNLKNNEIENQEMSRSLKEFIRNKKKLQGQLDNPSSRKKSIIQKKSKDNEFQTNEDFKGMTRRLRDVPKFNQKKGERDFQFIKRVEAISQEVLGASRFEDKYKLNVNPTEEELENKKRKKEEWKAKKREKREKKKKRRGNDVTNAVTQLAEKNRAQIRHKKSLDFNDLRDDVPFGEVVLAPPTLTAIPRKAEVSNSRPKNLLLASMVGSKGINSDNSSREKHEQNKNKNNGVKTKKVMKFKDMSVAQKATLIREKHRVIERYRKMRDGTLFGRNTVAV